jgi:hypothetical protein
MEKAFYVSVAYDYNRLHFSEWNGDEKWVDNYGNQDGVRYTVGYRSPRAFKFIGHPFIEGYYRELDNTIKFRGVNGAGNPLDLDQRSKLKQFGMKFGSWGKISEKSEVYGYLDIGRRLWNKGEDNDLDYLEQFSWYYTGLGAGINHRFFTKLSTGIEAEVMFGWQARDRIDYFDFTYHLSDVYGFELKLPLKYYLLKSLSFDFTPYLTFWNVGSSSNDIGDSQKYDGYTHQEGLLLGLTYSF